MPLPTDLFEDNFTFKFTSPKFSFKQWLAKPLSGRIDFEYFQLNKSKIYYKDIISTTGYENYFVLTLAPYATISAEISSRLLPDSTTLIIKLRGNSKGFEHKIDRKISQIRIEEAKIKAAKLSLPFRKSQCPKCQCELDLTGKNESQYTFCGYCDNIYDRNSFLIPNSESYQICPDCQYYGRVQTYYVLDFYFLIIQAGFKLSKHFFCDTCAERMFFKTFFRNLTLIVGAFFSLWQYFRSQLGRNPYLENLGKANLYAQNGKMVAADSLYNSLLTRNFGHPGIHYNYGLAYLKKGDAGRAAIQFQKCLSLCSNYEPVIELMRKHKDVEILLTKDGGLSQLSRAEG
jgi:hypothetical protein